MYTSHYIPYVYTLRNILACIRFSVSSFSPKQHTVRYQCPCVPSNAPWSLIFKKNHSIETLSSIFTYCKQLLINSGGKTGRGECFSFRRHNKLCIHMTGPEAQGTGEATDKKSIYHFHLWNIKPRPKASIIHHRRDPVIAESKPWTLEKINFFSLPFASHSTVTL